MNIHHIKHRPGKHPEGLISNRYIADKSYCYFPFFLWNKWCNIPQQLLANTANGVTGTNWCWYQIPELSYLGSILLTLGPNLIFVVQLCVRVTHLCWPECRWCRGQGTDPTAAPGWTARRWRHRHVTAPAPGDWPGGGRAAGGGGRVHWPVAGCPHLGKSQTGPIWSQNGYISTWPSGKLHFIVKKITRNLLKICQQLSFFFF